MKSSFFINKPNNKIIDNITTNTLKNSDASIFHSSLKEYKTTPLTSLPCLAKKYNVGNIYVKDESFRLGLNAFKGLGASYAIRQILKNNPKIQTFCTATDGNHGRAVAWSAKSFDKKAVVYVPLGTTKQRIEAIEKNGAIVEVVNGNYDEACEYAQKMADENGWALVQDMAWSGYEEIPALIVAGYLTLFKEIEEVITLKTKIDVVFLQAGVGSFAGAGIYHYLQKYGVNRPKIVIVEPNEADAILESFKANKISTSLGTSKTIMAGLNCGTPSLGIWDLIKNATDISLKIDDKYAQKAMRELYTPTGSDKRIISGESGVGGLAGFIAMKSEDELKPLIEKLNINENSNILFISTEGATDMEMFNKINNIS
ncbi:diaminopropionate ammonia-lyase [Sulfurospirillum sp.]|nr:diaminopropionate ammonia-lyase [Sulfurospirillum sp.]